MREIKFRAWDKAENEWCAIGMEYSDAIQGPISKPTVFNGRNQCVIMQFTGLLDRHGVEIYEGDIILGEQHYISSDGYLRKSYPPTIKVRCEVVYSRGTFEYPRIIGPIPEHTEAYNRYSYRGIGYYLTPLPKGHSKWNADTRNFDIEGDNMTCYDIEVIGNIYENPELLEANQ